jgi:hypothetical protein
MFIISEFCIIKQIVSIISVHNLLIDAIESLHNHVSVFTDPIEYQVYYEDDPLQTTYDIQVKSQNRIEIYQRTYGWITSSKNLSKIFEIKEFEGTFEC